VHALLAFYLVGVGVCSRGVCKVGTLVLNYMVVYRDFCHLPRKHSDYSLAASSLKP